MVTEKDDLSISNIDKIIKHRGKVARLATLQFYVNWKGFEDSENSWISYKKLRGSNILNNYLKDNNLFIN